MYFQNTKLTKELTHYGNIFKDLENASNFIGSITGLSMENL